MPAEDVRAILRAFQERPIAFYPVFARIGGSVNAGLMLSQLFYWTPFGDDDGWVYKTQSEWEIETCLGRREQETARRQLKESGVWEEKLAGSPARLYYRVDVDALQQAIIELEARQTRMADSAKLGSEKPPNKDGGKRQSLTYRDYAETTTETIEGRVAPSRKLGPEGLGPIVDAFKAQGVTPPNFASQNNRKAAVELLTNGVEPGEIILSPFLQT